MKIYDWNIEEVTGYVPKTTFFMDFSIADEFGIEAVKDTYKRAFEEWHNNVVYITELSLVLNWKCWQHYEQFLTASLDEKKRHDDLARLYHDLYYQNHDWCYENLTGVDLDYYFYTTD